ncbi:MAG: DedA family protein [Anaerolineae bacterium]|nr:DedA family protein [Anaerolineae bacterium]
MLADLVEFFAGIIEDLILRFGAVGIWAIALLENVFPPTPSDAIYPLAGKLAYEGHIGLRSVLIAGTLGTLSGSLLYYHVGRWLGEARLRAWVMRWGSFRVLGVQVTLFAMRDLDRTLRLFQERGEWIVCLGRFIPVLHSLISIPAGVARMNRTRFAFYTALGAILNAGPRVLLGYWLGAYWDQLLNSLRLYESLWILVLGGAVLALILYRVMRFRRQRLSERLHHAVD